MIEVSMQELDAAFSRRRTSHPKEDPNVALKHVAHELHIEGPQFENIRGSFIDQRVRAIVGTWSRRHGIDRKTLQLPLGDRN